MGKQTDLTAAQRAEAVMALLRREEPATAIARRFGISEPTLYRYRDLFLEGGKAAVAAKSGADNGRVAQMERELAERDRVIGELTVVNRVLKKLSGQ